METELVIFDCDGVLVASERIGNEVLAAVITEQGWAVDVDDCIRLFQGGAMPDIWRTVSAHTGREVSQAVNDDFPKRQLAALAAGVQAMPGIRDLLGDLTVPYCVASNAPHAKMHVTLGATQLLSFFEGKMFSREDVPRPKPFPDLFLHAAGEMKALASRCVVGEDSPVGVRAAIAGGMRVVGYAGNSTAATEALAGAGAQRVLGELSELLTFL